MAIVGLHGTFLEITADRTKIVQKNFVEVVRAVELAFGITVPGSKFKFTSPVNFTASFNGLRARDIFNEEVVAVLEEAIPIISKVALQFKISPIPDSSHRTPLLTKCVRNYFD